MLQVIILALAAALSAPPALAQVPVLDLQPGRNFPTVTSVFGAGRAGGVDLGDVDNDGDLDVGFANGGDGGPQPNTLFINQGGAQSGAAGSFSDESATRFAGLPSDTSRDLQFFDMDDDGDLDVFVANRGTTVNGGEVSRLYRNLGGRQHGAVGFFDDFTDSFWGSTVSVPEVQQIGTPDDFGPWKGWTRTIDVIDVDDDGDLDLMPTSHGVNFSGTEFERLFLNDGHGTLHELFPWADDLADVKWHSNEVDFADLDGDFDLDLFVSSRNSQSRVFRNELAEGQPGGRLFTDVTQTALLDTGSAQSSNSTYGVELGDLDGDGDFDAWVVNYGKNAQSNREVFLRNDGDMLFRRPLVNPITADPVIDDIEVEFLDFDGDGDLDVHVSSWLGANYLYQSSVAQPLADPRLILHRTGAGTYAPGHELPSSGNFANTNDTDFADMDGDGDPDGVIANDLNQNNRYMENVLGVPDTHAPSFHAITQQVDKSDGTPTVIHAAVRDNAGMKSVDRSRTQLVFSVDGGAETCVRMRAQGGQQFRGVIPASLEGSVSYRVEVVDEAGNTAVSATFVFEQSNPGSSAVSALGCGTAGIDGVPIFEAHGDLTPASLVRFSLRHAAPSAFAMLFVSLSSSPVPFKQGTLHAFPVGVFQSRTTDAGGLDALELTWPDTSVFPSGLEFWMQYGVQDASVFGAGASLSNAARLEVP